MIPKLTTATAAIDALDLLVRAMGHGTVWKPVAFRHMAQTTPAQSEEVQHARAAGLTYASDTDPGIRRFAKGTGFHLPRRGREDRHRQGDAATQTQHGNNSYGLTTLTSRHIAIEGSELRFHFKGKSGKTWRFQVKDRRIARIARSIQELPGQQLFKYVDDDGAVCSIDSSDVNEYLREVAGSEVSAKDFRTWAGTVLAAMALSAVGAFETKSQAKTNVRRAVCVVAERLGNTATVCRKCYIHPELLACYFEGALPAIGRTDVSEVPSASLPQEEAAVLRLLERRLRNPRRSRGKTTGVTAAA